MGTEEQIIGIIPVVVAAGVAKKVIDNSMKNKKHVSIAEHARSKRYI